LAAAKIAAGLPAFAPPQPYGSFCY